MPLHTNEVVRPYTTVAPVTLHSCNALLIVASLLFLECTAVQHRLSGVAGVARGSLQKASDTVAEDDDDDDDNNDDHNDDDDDDDPDHANDTGEEGWCKPRTPGFPAYHLVHIPKTAGASLTYDIPPHLPDGFGFYAQEGCFPTMAEEMEPNDRMVVILRDPVSHVYSEYLECADDDWGREATAHYRNIMVNVSTWLHHFTQSENRSAKDVFDLNCYHPLNMQTRALTCLEDSFDASHHYAPASLQEALTHMKDPSVLLVLAEYYQESVCIILEEAIGELPSYCNCDDRKAWTGFAPSRVSHHERPHSLSDLSDDDVASIRLLTGDDFHLYQVGRKIFFDKISVVEAKHKVKIICER